MNSKNKFVLNSENGYWGIASPNREDELRRHLENLDPPKKRYKGIQLIVLNTTKKCNLACAYCSTKGERSSDSMPLEIATAVIDKSLGISDSPIILFHGSEPLLNWQLVQEAVLYGEPADRDGKLRFSIQTNLTELTDDKLDFIREHKIGVSTSLDGLEQHHNLTRPYADGSSSYHDVCRGIEKILRFQDGMCAICVVTKHNVDSLDKIALDFEKKGITEVQFIPAVDCTGKGDFRAVNSKLTEGYIRLFEQTLSRIESGEQKIHVRNLMQYVSSLFCNTGIDACRFCSSSTFHPLFAVDTDGEVYACDFFWGNKQNSLGRIQNIEILEIINNNPRMRNIDDTSCSPCDFKKICGGGCLADSFFSSGKTYYCPTHKAVFSYLSKKVPELLDKGLATKILYDDY